VGAVSAHYEARKPDYPICARHFLRTAHVVATPDVAV